MKKRIPSLLCILLMLTMLPITAFADPGEGNIDGGGGGMGQGTSSNTWTPGHDGVRVTVIRDSDNAPVSTPIDYTNIVPPANMTSFNKLSKLDYRNGAALVPNINSYSYLNPDIALPRIISSGSNASTIEAIKRYFCSEYAAMMVARDIGIPYESLIRCKWRTPDTPQTVTIHVLCSGGSASSSTITAKIVDLNENPPPNPTARDRNDGFRVPSLPSKPQQTSASWSVWYCYWVPKWERCWHGSGDDEWYHWVDNGDWAYDQDHYYASLSGSVRTTPDDKAATASGKNMKSGYGITISVNGQVYSNAPTSHTTWAQNAVSYFPEFSYDTYWRLHDRVVSGYNSTLDLKNNIYSTYNRPVHFTPVWFPNTTYTTYTYLIDAWTPVGMLSMNLNDYVSINQSVFDDWHVAPQK